MLPDFASVRKLLDNLFKMLLKGDRTGKNPLLQQIRQEVFYEGDRHSVQLSDGTVDHVKFERIEGTFTITREDIAKRGPEAVLEGIDKAAGELGTEMMKLLIRKIDQITEQTGQRSDGRGKPFSLDQLLDAYDKVQVDFDENGVPYPMTFLASPELVDKFRAMQMTDEQKKRHDEITERQRLDWRNRESDRRLVS